MTIKLLIKTSINRTLFGFHPFSIHALLLFQEPHHIQFSCLASFTLSGTVFQSLLFHHLDSPEDHWSGVQENGISRWLWW